MNILNDLLFSKYKLHHRCSTGLYIGLWKHWNFQREAKVEQIIAIVTTRSVPCAICKIHFIFLMTLIDITKNQNTKCRVIWDRIYTCQIKIYSRDKTWNIVGFTITLDKFSKLGAYNSGYSILGFYNVLVQIRIAISKTKLNLQHQVWVKTWA